MSPTPSPGCSPPLSPYVLCPPQSKCARKASRLNCRRISRVSFFGKHMPKVNDWLQEEIAFEGFISDFLCEVPKIWSVSV